MQIGNLNNKFDQITQDGKVSKDEYKDLKETVRGLNLPKDEEKAFMKLINKAKGYSNETKFLFFKISDGELSKHELRNLKKIANTIDNPIANDFLNSFLSKVELGKGLIRTNSNSDYTNKAYDSSNFKPSRFDFQINSQINSERADFSFSNKSESEQFDHFSDLVKSNGGEVDLTPGKKNIVSLRVPSDPKVNGGKGVYDDQTAVFWVDKQGNKRVSKFKSNTDPSAQFAGNGYRSDQGRIRAGGTNKFRVSSSSNLGRVLRPVSSVNVDRYYNGEFKAVGSGNTSFLFHAGGYNNTGSAGCQTMNPSDYENFWATINSDGNPGEINYTVVESNA